MFGGDEGFEAADVALDFGGAPVLRADEAAADHSAGVDDVGLGRARGSEGEVGFVGGVEDDGHVVELVVGDVLLVVGGIAVKGDGDDDEVGELVLELLEGGPLGGAVDAPRGPEIEHDNFAAVLGERDGLGAVVNGDVGRGAVDVCGVASAIAAGGGDGESGDESGGAEDGADGHVSIIMDIHMKTAFADPVKMIQKGAPRLIGNDEELAGCTAELFALTGKEKTTPEEDEAIELLTLLIEHYEAERFIGG